MVQIQLPDGAAPGAQCTFVMPSGTAVTVTVPDGAGPGTVLDVADPGAHTPAAAGAHTPAAPGAWTQPGARAVMVDAKAKFVELERALAAADDWTHDEEDRVRDTIEALEHEFEAYLAEARGQVAELADISATTGEDDKIVYDIARKKADKDPDVDWSFIDRVAPTIEGKQACQPTGDVAMLYRQARSIHGDFSRLVEGVEASLGAGCKAKARVAPLKHLYRIVEKKTFSTRYPGRADGVCDIVRALFECETKAAMASVYEALATHEGLVVVRGKDRWRHPTEGGWADFMVNFRLKADRNRHVAEVQIVHRKLMIAREGLDGHAAYAQGRAATETLEKLEALGVALPKPTKHEPHAFAAELAAQPSAQQLAPPAATPAVAAPEKAVAAPVAQAMSARVAPEAPAGADFPGRVDPKTLDGDWCCYSPLVCSGKNYKRIAVSQDSYRQKGILLMFYGCAGCYPFDATYVRVAGTNTFADSKDGTQKEDWTKNHQTFNGNPCCLDCKLG